MIRRLLSRRMRRALSDNPAVALVGPRQSGKTTLARSLGGVYFDMEQEADRIRLDLAWTDLANGRRLVIIDEAQAWPVIFPRLRGAIDTFRKRNGRFLILGSVSPARMTQVSESLAGRLALLELSPLLATELPGKALSQLWLHGGYPEGGILKKARFPHWQLDYLALLAQRDLPAWGLPSRPQMTDRLLRLVAAVHGQIWNASQIGQALGLSYHTANTYLDYLENAFLVRRLHPFFANVRKRLVKSPKVYWRDSGLLHALLGIAEERQLLAQPWVGASWEGFVIEQVLGNLAAAGEKIPAYFFRTSDGHEIDLVLDFAGERWAVEIKLTAHPAPEDMARLNKAADLINADRRILVSQTRQPLRKDGQMSCALPDLLRLLARHAGRQSLVDRQPRP